MGWTGLFLQTLLIRPSAQPVSRFIGRKWARELPEGERSPAGSGLIGRPCSNRQGRRKHFPCCPRKIKGLCRDVSGMSEHTRSWLTLTLFSLLLMGHWHWAPNPVMGPHQR